MTCSEIGMTQEIFYYVKISDRGGGGGGGREGGNPHWKRKKKLPVPFITGDEYKCKVIHNKSVYKLVMTGVADHKSERREFLPGQ